MGESSILKVNREVMERILPLSKAIMTTVPLFGLALLTTCPEVPAKILTSPGTLGAMDTALPAPWDICKEDEAVTVEEPTYLAQPRSVVLLFSTINQTG
jgi:hypothetical protein